MFIVFLALVVLVALVMPLVGTMSDGTKNYYLLDKTFFVFLVLVCATRFFV